MDQRTLSAYDRAAAAFAVAWHEQAAPVDVQALVRRFFRAGPTADVGCGSGRDTAWLNDHGYPAIGYDPSDGLLAEARRRYPRLRFHRAELPELDGVADGGFTNVLCDTVIMHLAREAIGPAVRKLVAILEPEGTLLLTWRVTDGGDSRDDHGRLYTAVDPSLVRGELGAASTLLDEDIVGASSGKRAHRLVARKGKGEAG
jgi:SAM-dependent methyltransferase